jgi:hypothetical protein
MQALSRWAFVILALTTGWTAAQEVTLWYSPLVYENPARAPLVSWVEENAPKVLPEGYTLARDYGPPTYSEVEQRYIVQARSSFAATCAGVLVALLVASTKGSSSA